MEIRRFATPEETDRAFEQAVIATNVLLDIGCGIRPFSLFKPKVHLAVEPWHEYLPLLRRRFATEPGFVPLRLTGPEGLGAFPDRAVDTVAIMDVIEHLEKAEGRRLLGEAERLARRQVLVFTPLGFLGQEFAPGEADAWGFGNIELQRHRSGWTPEDFGTGWDILTCDQYHLPAAEQGDGIGAFYAVKTVATPSRRRLPEKTLVVSNLALPPAPSEPTEFVALKQAFQRVFAEIEPGDFAILTSHCFAAYNPRIVFDLKDYALWRLPVDYYESGILRTPNRFFDAPPELLATDCLREHEDFRALVLRIARAIEEMDAKVVLYVDRFDANFFIAAAAAVITGRRLRASDLPPPWNLPVGLPAVEALRAECLPKLDLAGLSTDEAIEGILRIY
jgi:hypothetical protein